MGEKVASLHRVLISAISRRPEISSMLPALEKEFRARSIEALTRPADAGASPGLDAIDLVLVLGGDGYMMGVIRSLGYPTIPFYGVNYGRVGFLMNPRMEAGDLVDRIASGEMLSKSYPVLEASIRLTDGTQKQDHALNDFVLERASGQTVRIYIYIDDVLLNCYGGDGLIVATPGGSTAYSLAAGGPVVHHSVDGILVTPLYAHRPVQFHSLQFPILLPLASRVRIVPEDLEKRPLRLVADGHTIDEVAEVEITYSGRQVRLLRVPDYSFISTLVNKIIGHVPAFPGQDVSP